MKVASLYVVALCGVVLLGGIPSKAQAPPILESKVERLEGPPLWIAAEAVVDEEKIVDLDRVDSIALRMNVEKQRQEIGEDGIAEKFNAGEKPAILEIPASECKRSQYAEDHRGGVGSTATLSALATNSKSILRGTIRTIGFGFDGGVPGSLLGVEPLEAVKGSAPRPMFYILYPVARFRIGPLHFCNANKGFEPKVGDEVLLFDFTGPVDRDQVLFGPKMDQIFFQRKKGTLSLPPQLESTGALAEVDSLEEIVRKLRSMNAQRQEP